MTSGGPLAGVRIVDLTINLSGPFGTIVLAQQGADVIKIERPPTGDILRGVGSQRGGVSAYFVNSNWGKRSITLDLPGRGPRHAAAHARHRRRVGGELPADGDARLRLRARGRGGGASAADLCGGPWVPVGLEVRGGARVRPCDPGHDRLRLVPGRPPQGTPVLVQQAVVDKVTGLTMAQAITAALFERERTNRGQLLEIPMLHAGLAFLWPDAATNASLVGDADKLPPQSRTFRLTKTADGYVSLVAIANDQFDGLMRVVGKDDMVGHPDLNSPGKRGRNGAQVMREVGAFLRERTTVEVLELLSANGVPCGPVTDLDDVAGYIDDIAPGFMVRETHPQLGGVVHPSPAVRFDEPVDVRPTPALGEHTDEVLAELERG